MASVKKRETGDHEMSEEQDIHDAEAFRREQERMIREHAEWPQRLEPVCREAEARWRAAHPWTGDRAFFVSVPVRCGGRSPEHCRGTWRARDEKTGNQETASHATPT
jgi:hypothetical protein